MKLYQPIMIIILLSGTLYGQAFWSKWIDNITAKINNTTDVILHKEFSHAKKLELYNHHGSIFIHSWNQNSIAIEVIISCAQPFHKDVVVDIECIEDIIKIHTNFPEEKFKASIIFNILVPKHLPLILSTLHGDIIINDVQASLELTSKSGNIKVLNSHAKLYATTTQGDITIRTPHLEKDHEMRLNTSKGDIEIYTTQTINTYLHAYAPQGKVSSDLFVTLDPQTTQLNSQAWKNFRQIVHGTIGQPLSQLHATAENGCITLMPILQQNDIF